MAGREHAVLAPRLGKSGPFVGMKVSVGMRAPPATPVFWWQWPPCGVVPGATFCPLPGPLFAAGPGNRLPVRRWVGRLAGGEPGSLVGMFLCRPTV